MMMSCHESAADFATTNRDSDARFAGPEGNNPFVHKASSVFKGVLIASATVYVAITWALQAIARFN